MEYFRGDLHAADCIYHNTCSINFRTGKNISQKVCNYFETVIKDQVTLAELKSKMDDFLSPTEIPSYDTRWLKQKLTQHYGDNILLVGEIGKSCLITLRDKASSILREFHGKPKPVHKSEKTLSIETAAKLIFSDIKTHSFNPSNSYPRINDFSVENLELFLLNSLKTFMKKLLPNDTVKTNSIGQSIVQALRPRSGDLGNYVVTRRIVNNAELLYISYVDIKDYPNTNTNIVPKIHFSKLDTVESKSFNVDFLWKLSLKFSNPIPSWPGFMRLIHDTTYENYEKDQYSYL